jgi:hypothetical protein
MITALKKTILSKLLQLTKFALGSVKTNAKRNGIKVIRPIFRIIPAKGQCMFFHSNPKDTKNRTTLEATPMYFRKVT